VARPINTPVLLLRKLLGSIPELINASKLTSNKSRCCGSKYSASLGLIPKKSASKKSIGSLIKLPLRVTIFPGTSGLGS